MSTHTPYTTELHNTKEIRLVRVSAGRWHDPIRCILIRWKLNNAAGQLPYRALSYVWRNSAVTDTIDLQELPFQITLNLSCALRHLRKVDGEILLWVDAICINQKDHEERGLQVSIMKLIYKNAEQVAVFMGDGRSHRVIRSHLKEPHVYPMTTLDGPVRNKRFLSDMWRACGSSGPRKLASSLPAATCAIGLISLFSDEETVEEGCVELMKLGERDRIWVVREIAVGTVVTIHYGTISLPWKILVATANVWSLPKTRQVASSAGIEPENQKVFALFANQLTGLEQARRKWHAEGGTDLVRLLQEFSDRQASDDRDKVYGLLSLARHGQQYIKPNYFFDVFHTYRFTALALIANGDSLACWAGDQKRKFNRGLPSWIPDWSTAVDDGDKRRMDLFESYGANCGWTVRFIENEMHYWTTVEDEMELLLNSPAGQGLSASLNRFVLDYIELLMQRSKSLFPFEGRRHQHYIEAMSLYHLKWDWSQGATPPSTLKSLEWCESHNVIPHCGRGLLRRWMRDVRKRQDEIPVQQVAEEGAEQSDGPSMKIGRALGELEVILRDDYRDIEHRTQHAQSLVYGIESIILGTANIPMVLVDSVTDCGPRQFGWTDIKSALTTLVSWLYVSWPVIASGEPAEPGEVQLNDARIRQFAKTIVGGMCRRGGAYQKADDTPLGPLEDWLRQCLMVSTGPLTWEYFESYSTSSRGGFITLEDRIQISARERLWSRWRGNDHEGGLVVPQQGRLRRSLESRDFAAPPSPFFEDIQVATDGRPRRNQSSKNLFRLRSRM
ncbi:hypothetical protein LA080_011455 [Diaporthe eres]|nr:hypothetical protein LA080_011455 [Diaporthe eres]